MNQLKILIPVDFTELTEYAVEYIRNFRDYFELEILFLNVVEISIFADVNKEGHFEDMMGINTEMLEIQQQAAKEKMHELYQSVSKEFKDISTYIKLGPLTDTIVSFAEKKKVDMILMGTKGVSNLKALFSGSETQIVARRSNNPVLTIMSSRPGQKINQLLFISDFTDIEVAPDPVIRKLAEGFKAKIHLLCIATSKLKAGTAPESCNAHMNHYAKEHRLTNFEIHVNPHKKVIDGINHFDKMEEMDMIAIGTHGRKGVSHLIKGSIAENLINYLHKPVLVYKI